MNKWDVYNFMENLDRIRIEKRSKKIFKAY